MLRYSKGYCSPSFHLISTIFYCKYVGHEGIQAVTVLAICQNLKFYGTLTFFVNTEQWENLKCGISQKRLIVERNGWRFGTRATTVHLCRALLMLDCLSLVWGHLVHFAKFPTLQFFLQLCSFHNFHPNFIQGIISYRLSLFLVIGQKLQKLWHFEIFS